jgi:capsular exopolysaccharide synthesis family protein
MNSALLGEGGLVNDPSGVNSHSEMKKIGMLSQDLKTELMENGRELSAVEGNLLSVAESRHIKKIFITSCFTSEGKTVSAISMAYALSTSANAKVLLVDGNLHFPKIHELFNVKAIPGLSDLLIANADYSSVVRETEYQSLNIMPHGTGISDTLGVFRSKIFKDKLDFLSQSFDYIIFDGSSILSSSEAALTAKHFDGIILVIECEKTKWEVVQLAIEKIRNVGGIILGVVLNKRKFYIPKILYGKI